ncbi:MAG: TIGR04219 family outer membrane beta-barrel protein, partial [Halomonadaceae bacterium]
PLIPNFRIRYTEYDETESGQANTTFQGQQFTGDVRTTLDLSHYDYTIFYTAPLPVVGLDLGFNVKHFTGEVVMQDRNNPGNRESVNLKEMIPMLYAHGRVDLPLTGLGAGAEISYISFDGDTVSDMELYLGYSYQLVYGQVGYRDFSVDIEGSGDLEVDADITGPFARIGVRF